MCLQENKKFKVGDLVELNQDYDGFAKGFQFTITEIEPSCLSGRTMVYGESEMGSHMNGVFSTRLNLVEKETGDSFKVGDRAILTKIENGYGEDLSEGYNLPMVVVLASRDEHPSYDYQARDESGNFVSAVKAKYLHRTDGKFPVEEEKDRQTIDINGNTYYLEDVASIVTNELQPVE